jgi:shikimate 5-dehydrogenase
LKCSLFSGQAKITLIGAGGRGTGAAVNALRNASHKNVKLVERPDYSCLNASIGSSREAFQAG